MSNPEKLQVRDIHCCFGGNLASCWSNPRKTFPCPDRRQFVPMPWRIPRTCGHTKLLSMSFSKRLAMTAWAPDVWVPPARANMHRCCAPAAANGFSFFFFFPPPFTAANVNPAQAISRFHGKILALPDSCPDSLSLRRKSLAGRQRALGIERR